VTATLAKPSGQQSARLLTVSNRGPFEFHRDEDGEIRAVPGQGGLATALRAAATIYPTTWLSSPLTDVDRKIADGSSEAPAVDDASHFVATDPDAYDLFYGSFSNELLWFVQHGLELPEELDAERRKLAWEQGYVPVNRAFADAVVREIDSGQYRAVMFHDYHFYLAPGLVKQARPGAYLQHFIHIPWPGPGEWIRLDQPVLRAMLEGLLGNDSLVFQTATDVQGFLQTVKAWLPGAAVDLQGGAVQLEAHTTRVWANGISVDPDELAAEAATPDYSRYRWLLRGSPGQKTIVRVDRLDLTKNVLRGFQAYERLLEDHRELHEQVQFLALLVPSKEAIAAYKRYQEETQELAERINRRFGSRRWKPIWLLYEHNRTQALAALSLYNVLLVNPIADGMNLVAKEGPLLNTHDGVLVLSKRAGAWQELSVGAIGVDPEDVEGTAAALYEALNMSQRERHERAMALKGAIRGYDLRAWFSALLRDIEVNAPLPQISAA
jgi:trehalose 6-phosphate synthase